jgi:hypothetical protein
MRRPVVLAIAAAVLVLVFLLWLWHHRDGERQVRATFARLETEITGGDAAGVVSELHPDYDFVGEWPGLFDSPELRSALGNGEADPKNRDMARRGLAFLFLNHRDRPYCFLYTIQKIVLAGDGTATVSVTLEVGDGTNMIIDPQTPRTFVLKPVGWLGTMEIVSHDHFTAPTQ